MSKGEADGAAPSLLLVTENWALWEFFIHRHTYEGSSAGKDAA
jgi:hypothetical protein